MSKDQNAEVQWGHGMKLWAHNMSRGEKLRDVPSTAMALDIDDDGTASTVWILQHILWIQILKFDRPAITACLKLNRNKM